MPPQLIVIDSIEALLELREYLKCFEYVAYDCETTGLTQRDQIIGFSVCASEDKAFYVILHKFTQAGGLEPVLDGKPEILDLIHSLASKSLIMHNGVFDCMMAESYFKVSLISGLHTDTMILAHLLDENRRVGLKELAKQYFGDNSTDEQVEMKASILANGGELTKANYELYKADAYLIGKYGAKDALLTFKLFNELIPELVEQGLYDFFYNDESMPLLRGPTYELNTTGLQVDLLALIVLKKTLEAECAEAKAFIHQEIVSHIGQKFNIGSNQQLSELLFGKLGLEFGKLTKGGKAICQHLGIRNPYTFSAKRDFITRCTNAVGEIWQPEAIVNGKKIKAKKVREPWNYIGVDKAILSKLAPKHKWIARLLEYQRKNKILNTYVKGIETRVQYGIIRPSFLQHGTTSGRYSSRSPNWQNLPRDDKRIKACVVPRAGKIFVGADYSQLEPRVFAYISGDERLIAAFKTGDDIYSTVGINVYNKTECIPKKEGSSNAFGVMYPKLRQDTKTFMLAATYGATGHQLAPMMGKSSDDAQRDIDAYLEEFTSVAKMMKDSHKMAKETGQVISLFGRPRRIPEAKRIAKLYGTGDLPYEARKLLNLSVNHRIQSTAASIANRATIRLYNDLKQAGIDCKIVCQVHDSIILECNIQDAENVGILLQNAMENTTILEGVALEASPKIGKTFAEV
jgi:DNA polymerase I